MISLINIAATCITLCQCARFRDSRYSYYEDAEYLPYDERVPAIGTPVDFEEYELIDNVPFELKFNPVREDELLFENDLFKQTYPRSWEDEVYGTEKKAVIAIPLIKVSFSKVNDTVSFVKNAVKVLETVHEEFTANEDTKAILEYIYEKLNKDPRKLALFVASSFYNTSYFTKFDDGSKKPFGARGLMMISGEKNYERLEKITSWDYTKAYCTLANQTRMAVYHTIDFWTKLMYSPLYTTKQAFEKFVETRESKATIDEPTFRNFYRIASGIYGFATKK